MVAARIATLKVGRPQTEIGAMATIDSREAVGRLLNISPQSISAARLILEHGSPQHIAAVDARRRLVEDYQQAHQVGHAQKLSRRQSQGCEVSGQLGPHPAHARTQWLVASIAGGIGESFQDAAGERCKTQSLSLLPKTCTAVSLLNPSGQSLRLGLLHGNSATISIAKRVCKFAHPPLVAIKRATPRIQLARPQRDGRRAAPSNNLQPATAPSAVPTTTENIHGP
jgi:hypothetical protein